MRIRPLTAAIAAVVLSAAVSQAETILPCRQPQLAAHGRDVFVACGTEKSILVARSADGGRTFGAPVTVATPRSLALGARRGPRIVSLGDTLVVTAIVGELGGGKDGDVVAWRSADRGRVWSGPTRLNDVANAAREGLHTMSAAANTIAVAWLDLRERGTTLVVSVSTDDGQHWGPDVVAYRSPSGSICECCHPSIAVGPPGSLIAMFRNNLQGARDMYVVGSTDAGLSWSAATKLGNGTWPLKACPMDGGALAVDASGAAVTAWRREQTVYVTTPGNEEKAIGSGVNPALALAAAGTTIAWNDVEGLTMQPPAGTPELIDARGKFASLVSSEGGVVVAYERGAETVVRRP